MLILTYVILHFKSWSFIANFYFWSLFYTSIQVVFYSTLHFTQASRKVLIYLSIFNVKFPLIFFLRVILS